MSEHNETASTYQTDLSRTLAAIELAKDVLDTLAPGHIGQKIAQIKAQAACMAFVVRHAHTLRTAVGDA